MMEGVGWRSEWGAKEDKYCNTGFFLNELGIEWLCMYCK